MFEYQYLCRLYIYIYSVLLMLNRQQHMHVYILEFPLTFLASLWMLVCVGKYNFLCNHPGGFLIRQRKFPRHKHGGSYSTKPAASTAGDVHLYIS